jgi:uroporphyrinogen-III synthase
VPFYVVGQATASVLKELENLYAGIGFCRLDIRGESSGTAEQLAHFILNDSISGSGQMLYLTGDKNRDTLPNILSGTGIELHPLRVYETQGSSTFEQELLIALESFPKGECVPFLFLHPCQLSYQIILHGGLFTLRHPQPGL